MRHPAALGLVVVETHDGRAFLGQPEVVKDALIVRTGLPGRPAVIPLTDVAEVTMAPFHPDVEVSA